MDEQNEIASVERPYQIIERRYYGVNADRLKIVWTVEIQRDIYGVLAGSLAYGHLYDCAGWCMYSYGALSTLAEAQEQIESHWPGHAKRKLPVDDAGGPIEIVSLYQINERVMLDRGIRI